MMSFSSALLSTPHPFFILFFIHSFIHSYIIPPLAGFQGLIDIQPSKKSYKFHLPIPSISSCLFRHPHLFQPPSLSAFFADLHDDGPQYTHNTHTIHTQYTRNTHTLRELGPSYRVYPTLLYLLWPSCFPYPSSVLDVPDYQCVYTMSSLQTPRLKVSWRAEEQDHLWSCITRIL